MKIYTINIKTIVVSVLTVFVFILTGCEREEEMIEDTLQSDTEFLHDETSEVSIDNESIPVSKKVAIIQKEGIEYHFLATEDGESTYVSVAERIYGHFTLEEFEAMDKKEPISPYDLFLSITNPDIALPKVISELVAPEVFAVSGRSVQQGNTLLEIMDLDYVETTPLAKANCVKSSCTKSAFETEKCLLPISSNFRHMEYCDSGLWTSLYRNSYFAGRLYEVTDITTWTFVQSGGYLELKILIKEKETNTWTLKVTHTLPEGVWRVDGRHTRTYDACSSIFRNCPAIGGFHMRVERRAIGGNRFRAYTRFHFNDCCINL